jgi:hypothetical protein
MSNHSGSYMLNEFLHGLLEMGILKEMSATQKTSLDKLLRSAVYQHDCNWDEIIDAELATVLETCAYCRCRSTAICADNGYCVKCNQEAQQDQIRLGETNLLRELLGHRFGSLPHWVSQKMRSAAEKELLHWGERLVDDTSSLEEVFRSTDMQESS